MARGKTLEDILKQFRSECRLSRNEAHNSQDRDRQIEMLQRVQEELWEDFDWPHLRVDRFIELAAGQRYYSPPSDMHIDRIQTLAIRFGTVYYPMGDTIDEQHYAVYDSDLDQRGWPVLRWRISEDEQIEVWPIPNSNYDATTKDGQIKITGIRDLKDFINDDDTADLDDRLIALRAAAEQLAGKGARDAQIKADAAAKRYARLRGNLMTRTKVKLFGTGGSGRARPVRVPIAVYNDTGG